MRRTMFVVPADLVPVVQAACTDDVAKRLRRQLEKDLATGGVGDGDPAGWLRDARRGRAGGAARAGRRRVRGGAVRGRAAAADAALVLAGQELRRDRLHHLAGAHAARRRRGTWSGGTGAAGWSSGQFEWFRASAWLRPRPTAARDAAVLDAGAARVELARRWLRSFGPAPVSDLQWWGGWTGGQTKAALAALPVAEVDLDGQPGVALADDLEFPAEVAPGAALLPALDPTPMGWQARDVVPRPAPGRAVRPDRQHRADRLVGGPRGRRLGPARVRRGRLPAA